LLLYYITDRNQFPGNASEKERRLLATISACAAAGVDYVQLREKDLSVRDLQTLATKAVAAIPAASRTRLLINSRIDVALASGAHGVHLPARDISATEARTIFARAGAANAIIAVSAHSLEEVSAAEDERADFAVFAPVFEKNGVANPQGLGQLRRICQRPAGTAPRMTVLALGGVNLENAGLCLEAGADGIAAIRLFQEGNPAEVIKRLRPAAVANPPS
jgi:thiamine-phosphate pyrophosphorylase